jgi:hypothetical protein
VFSWRPAGAEGNSGSASFFETSRVCRLVFNDRD